MSTTGPWWQSPAATWIDTLPIGDGRLGAKVFGGIDSERLALNIETLWSGRPVDSGIVSGPETLAAMRESLLAGDFVRAEALNRSLQGPFNSAYQPLGDLFIDFDGSGDVDSYRHELDMSRGIATCRFRRNGIAIERTALVSHRQRAVVIAIEAAATVTLHIRLTTPHPVHMEHRYGHQWVLAGFAPDSIDQPACHAAGQVRPTPGMIYSADGGVGFAVGLNCSGDAKFEWRGDTIVAEGTRFVLTITAETTFQAWDQPPGRDLQPAIERVQAELVAAAGTDIATILADHVDDHGALYGRVSLTLETPPEMRDASIESRMQAVRDGAGDPGLFALFHDFARYLLISSSRPGNALPANLQGIWNENRNPPWFSNFTTNINVQMNYWLAEPANLSECADPYLDFIESLAVAGQALARDAFGLDGWCVNHNVDIWRAAWPSGAGRLRPTWSFVPLCGAWLATSFAERDAFHPGDDRFLRERMAPLYEGTVRFGLGMLVRSPEGLVVLPSTSPENDYVLPSGETTDFDLGATYDQLLVRESFETYLGLARSLDIDSTLTQQVATTLDALPPTRIGKDGRLMEWSAEFAEPEPGHRHLSHLYGLFPGNQIDPVTTPDLAAAARLSLVRRMAGGSPEHGWPHAWMAACWARLHDGAMCESILASFIGQTLPGSTLSYHSLPNVYQIDGNLGIGAAITEMLLQSHRGVIRILPALPPSWQTGRFTGLRARGGVEVSCVWESDHAEVTLRAEVATVVKIASPYQAAELREISLSSGEPITVVLSDAFAC